MRYLNILLWAIKFIIKSITRSLKNENISFANILIPFLRSCSMRDQNISNIYASISHHSTQHDEASSCTFYKKHYFMLKVLLHGKVLIHDKYNSKYLSRNIGNINSFCFNEAEMICLLEKETYFLAKNIVNNVLCSVWPPRRRANYVL